MPKKNFKVAGHKIWILGNKCYRCGHEWRPRDIKIVPKVCPECKNPYWETPVKKKNEKKPK